MSFGNCIRCNRPFKLTESGKCPQCSVREQEQFSQMFQLLQDARQSGGIHIKELAEKIGLGENVVEEYFVEGRLGTAAPFINFTCKKCGDVYSGKEGHVSICIPCRALVSSQAGVGIRGRDEVHEAQSESKKMDLLSRVRQLGDSGGMRTANSDFRRSN